MPFFWWEALRYAAWLRLGPSHWMVVTRYADTHAGNIYLQAKICVQLAIHNFGSLIVF
jgi:hypothetical protein